MKDGTVIYARPKGHSTPEHDVIIAWCYLGYARFIDYILKSNPIYYEKPSL